LEHGRLRILLFNRAAREARGNNGPGQRGCEYEHRRAALRLRQVVLRLPRGKVILLLDKRFRGDFIGQFRGFWASTASATAA
jgi:hypothetical protein